MFEGVYVRIGSGAISGCLPLTCELLSSLYALPAFDDEYSYENMAAAANDMPWEASFRVAGPPTAHAVKSILADTMLATQALNPHAIDTAALTSAARAQAHLDAIKKLWVERPQMMPAEIKTIEAFLQTSGGDALQNVSIVYDTERQRLSALEQAVVDKLEAQHGKMDPDDPQLRWLQQGQAQGCVNNLLGHIQRNFWINDAERKVQDDSFRVLSVRDSLNECEAAAIIVQKLVADRGLDYKDIAIVIPDSSIYVCYLGEAFELAGIPLSSLPPSRPERNLGAELVSLFLQTRRQPAPAMALASLFSSPLLCWSSSIGQSFAKCVMDGDFSPRLAHDLEGQDRKLYSLLRELLSGENAHLAKQLRQLVQMLSSDKSLAEHISIAKSIIYDLIASLQVLNETAPIDWDAVLQMVHAKADLNPVRGPYLIGGVSVLTESERPKRSYKAILILGFNDGCFPTPAPGNAFFLDSELDGVRSSCGLHLLSRADILNRALELFHDQLCSASEYAFFLISERDRNGDSIFPSSSLPLFARLVAGIDKPERLVVSLDDRTSDFWNQLLGKTKAQIVTPLEEIATPEYYELGRDLLKVRMSSDGSPSAQSPSRLETLLVSPLAWLLNELDAQPVSWSPETLSVSLKGSLAHEVFEGLFLPGQAIPADEAICAGVPILLQQRITAIAPFLQAAIWGMERRTLEAEIIQSANNWAALLRELPAEVVGNEFWLEGEIFGHPIRGKADCLLRLSNGQPVIVDHKKSSTSNRRKRLEAKWDLQVDLYRNMRVRLGNKVSEETQAIEDCVSGWNDKPAVAYHLMNDSGVLLNGAADITHPSLEIIEGDIAEDAREHLKKKFADLRAGRLVPNAHTDEKFYSNTASLGTYALTSSPLIAAFSHCDDEATADDLATGGGDD